MAQLRIVHCADVHLETTFPERGGAAQRKALADAFVRIVDEALARDADILTIGGDLYESARSGPQTARFLFEQFARFGRPIFIAPGNHDPHAPTSLLARGDLPPNVKIFNEAAWRAYPLAEDVTLFGFGHTAAEPGRPFANAHFDRGGVQLALVHGSDEERCPPNKRATAPFTKSDVALSGATFLLTGHYHGGYIVADERGPVFGYPGSPEPIKAGEGNVHGALALTIDGARVTAEAIPIARTRSIEAVCDLHGVTSEQGAFACIEPALADFGMLDYVRLRLTGSVAPGTRLDTALMEDRLGATLGSLSIVDATVAYDYETIAREPTVRGHVVRDLLARGDDANEALRYALAAFDGTDIAP
ncbi:MAG: DNA repair exonuclease [Candidatus Eremiobacteraeota bacterium]|nr:DNA repair exonuclease [Candidatus Eremiobacteraeota bacterium]